MPFIASTPFSLLLLAGHEFNHDASRQIPGQQCCSQTVEMLVVTRERTAAKMRERLKMFAPNHGTY
jgi:hypothetical protein